jgi:hypothetical protein
VNDPHRHYQHGPSVERAAIVAHGVVFHGPRPMRHHDLIRAMAGVGVPTPINGTSAGGFMLSNGRFADRAAAKRAAYHAYQITYERFRSARVFCSEDLW